MSTSDRSIEALLRWRLARAEDDAPPPPSARLLLELARPWWDAWPDRFRAQVARLTAMSPAYGYAMTALDRERTAHPVPALIVSAEGIEAYARVSYLNLRDGRLRLRFRLDGAAGSIEQAFDSTFVAESGERPLFTARADLSQSGEYRVDIELPPTLAEDWTRLRVTDRMPFRLILQPVSVAG